MSRQESQPENLTRKQYWQIIILASLIGAAVIGVPYFAAKLMLSKSLHGGYVFSLMLLLPFIQGMLGGLWLGKYKLDYKKENITVIFPLLFDICLGILVFKEGYICLLIAIPFYLVLISLGYLGGRFFSNWKYKRTLQLVMFPAVMVFVGYDTAALPPPSFQNAISDAVTINASPEEVWQYVVEYPENTKTPEYWLWKIGLPTPIQSVADGRRVGSLRECRFTNGIVFKEKITEIKPGEVLTFDITEQPDHPEIIGHFSLDKGQIRLEPNADGSTTVIATSWYRLFVRPAFYFDWWAADIVRNVHFRVLGHIKNLVETEKQKNI